MIKKIFPILAIILVLTCISSVSAEDNQTHSLHSENTIQHETNQVHKTITKQTNTTVKSSTQTKSKIYVSTKGNDSNNGTENSPKRTIKDAIKSVKSGGTIHITPGKYYESGLTINKNINIIGENTKTTIINSQDKQAIKITAKANLKLFTIQQAKTNGSGGAIHNKGILKLENMTITTSTAKQSGGAIYNEGQLSIINSTLRQNNATNGGAIYNTNRALLKNCLFTKNNARSGSSIYTNGYLNIEECNFTKNQNTTIYITNNETRIKSSKFTYNNATNGGSIYNKQSILKINNVTFTKNNAKTSGGTIYNTGTTNIRNSQFKSNTAHYGATITNKNTTILHNNRFSNNNATLSGGAIYNTAKLSIKNNTFHNNRATNGGAIYSKTGTPIKINITYSHFTHNTAKTGGAIYAYNHTILNIKYSTFKSNNQSAIYIKTDQAGNNIYNSTFTKNSATYGGAIRNAYTNTSIKKNTFHENSANYGSTLHNFKGNIILNYNILADNNKDLYNKGNINADYNWWGKNSINRKRTVNIKPENWIYLTLTMKESGYENENITTTVSLNNIYDGKNMKQYDVEKKLPEVQINIHMDGCGINNQSFTTNQTYSKLVNNFTEIGKAVITAILDDEKLVHNTTIHKNVKDKRISGVYVQLYYDVTPALVKRWVKAGITDVYVQAKASTDETANLRKTISLCKNTNIRVHAWVICFRNKNGKFDVSTTQQNRIKNFIRKVININGVDGVSLDYVRYSGLNPSIVKPKVITNFVKSVHTIVKKHDENMIVSASLFAEKGGTVKYYGQDYAALSPYLDVMLPMTYRYSYKASRNWIKEATQYIVDRSPYSQVVSVVQTYYENLNKIPVNVLEKDIKAGLMGGSEGYVLFRQGLISGYPKSADKL
ncbi:right-handed parallel beta-helix repeat-containing protein [Methanosphaera sp. ISO3-F5]|uniref:right-handed parallel beta-helix repeat-containing protein n=1 Tax=Methanosphaera sp. ISO3-F5 TaxID=1452353 RepID=UPI002B25F45E|nr:right-handed parallel beta-helix repeat-containing protein [Methanosphaera sp. ISO3-F5]WQH64295.1 right-handed parallel beta-helix repeat-containing protein [Methanosphaera sp. ISO3-F5]